MVIQINSFHSVLCVFFFFLHKKFFNCNIHIGNDMQNQYALSSQLSPVHLVKLCYNGKNSVVDLDLHFS